MDDHVTKPIRVDTLRQALIRWMAADAGRRPAAALEGVAAAGEPSGEPPGGIRDAEAVDDDRLDEPRFESVGSGALDVHPSEASGVDLRDRPVLDLDGVLERMGGDLELLVEVAGMFLRHWPELHARMTRAIGAGDALGLAQAAHRVKGGAANIGAERVSALAAALEKRARAGGSVDHGESVVRLGAAVEELERAMEAVRAGRAVA